MLQTISVCGRSARVQCSGRSERAGDLRTMRSVRGNESEKWRRARSAAMHVGCDVTGREWCLRLSHSVTDARREWGRWKGGVGVSAMCQAGSGRVSFGGGGLRHDWREWEGDSGTLTNACDAGGRFLSIIDSRACRRRISGKVDVIGVGVSAVGREVGRGSRVEERGVYRNEGGRRPCLPGFLSASGVIPAQKLTCVGRLRDAAVYRAALSSSLCNFLRSLEGALLAAGVTDRPDDGRRAMFRRGRRRGAKRMRCDRRTETARTMPAGRKV